MSFYNRISILTLLVLGLIINSCANTIDPIDEETGIYGIYGVLNPKHEINKIRVKDLNVPYTEEATRNIDAEVTLENLEIGEATLIDSIALRNFEGVFLHNFIYEQPVIPDTEYRLTVRRSDGVSVSLLAKTPTRPMPRITPENPECDTDITFELDPTNNSTVEYLIGFKISPDSLRLLFPEQVLKDPDPMGSNISFTFNPQGEIDSKPFFSEQTCEDYFENAVYIVFTHYGPGFYERLNAPFDIVESTKRFGSLYTDTLGIFFDGSESPIIL